MNGPRKLTLLFPFIVLAAPLMFSSATNVYITPNGSAQGACTSNPQTPAWFNNPANWGSGSSQIGPGTTVTICGTFTGTAGSTELVFQGSGSSGNPITLLFDTNTQLNAPYWAPSSGGMGCGGAICMYAQSYVVVDGGSNGVIQNTENGDSFAYRQDSEAIEATSCNNCEVRNLTIQNIYVHPSGGNGSIDQTQMRCISISGSNWTISGNTMHDAGWCLFEAYKNGDTNIQISNNDIYNFDHGWMFATSSANSATNISFHDNRVHDTANWDASGCPFHHDGIHTFGTSGSSMSGINVYNNSFYGSWGNCPTGFIFVEGGSSSTPSHMQSSTWWNNVFLVSAGITNTNGWVDIASGESGTQQVYNNTIVGYSADNTLCFGIEHLSALTFKNNNMYQCGDPVSLQGTSPGSASIDYNFYGNYTCANGGNCFVNQSGGFEGSFSTWKSYCSCDSHSIQNNSTLFNSNGSPMAGAPNIQQGANLMTVASGNLSNLADDTSDGDIRAPISRPNGTCSTQGTSNCWDIGAYQYAAVQAPAPPTALSAVVQ